jgi:hypothetical protein
MRKLCTAALTACLTLGLTACGSSSSDGGRKTSAKPTQRAFDIDVHYDPPADKVAELAQSILSAGGVSKIADGLSHNLAIPVLLKIRVHNGTAGPFYDPETRTVNLTYGFVDYEAKVYRRAEPKIKDFDLGERLGALDGFILMHELGHALVDVYSLPITGREEDAVDELATVLMTRDITGGDQFAFFAAQFFHYLSGDHASYAESDYWDEHSLDEQRAYNIVCWVAGVSPADFNHIKKLGILGEDRLQRCPAEYQQKVKAWTTLLKPHARRA